MTDDLTGLHNLRSFEARLSTIMRASRDAGTPVSLLVLDVDRLKALNDKYGHLAGAEAVHTVGHIIARSLPPTAVGCRYGGDEFVVVLPCCAESHAKRIANDLCRKRVKKPFLMSCRPLGLPDTAGLKACTTAISSQAL